MKTSAKLILGVVGAGAVLMWWIKRAPKPLPPGVARSRAISDEMVSIKAQIAALKAQGLMVPTALTDRLGVLERMPYE